jgi:N-acetylglutamate synthase-like GNAT family acetyltransferase
MTDPATSPTRIRRARPDDAQALTQLARRAKAHWGYDVAFMERAADELIIGSSAIAEHEVWVLEGEDGSTLGFYRVIAGDPAELEDLWVEPAAIGSGYGRTMLEHAAAVARAGGASALELVADPNAVGFYERMGAVRIGVVPSPVVAGRELPRMRMSLAEDQADS